MSDDSDSIDEVRVRRLEVHCTDLRASLADLVRRIERIGGHSTPAEQADLRVARALLAEETP